MTGLQLRLTKRYHHQWFSSSIRDAADGWYGPYKTLEEAALKRATEEGASVVYVAQGYKMTKAEREEWGIGFNWQVDTLSAVEVRVP